MTSSQQRRAENEVIFKERNDAVKRLAKMLIHHGPEEEIKLKFVCECSNENCTETIPLTIAEYEQARRSTRDFILQTGHEQTDIERVVHRNGYTLVEKFTEPPATDGVLNKTH